MKGEIDDDEMAKSVAASQRITDAWAEARATNNVPTALLTMTADGIVHVGFAVPKKILAKMMLVMLQTLVEELE